jgi:hypothetical protein
MAETLKALPRTNTERPSALRDFVIGVYSSIAVASLFAISFWLLVRHVI